MNKESVDSVTDSIRNILINKCKVEQGDRIVAGVSGGADSVCLLLLLKEAEAELGLDLAALHVHHGIRGAEADRDADFTGRLCEELGVAFRLVKADVPDLARREGLSVEEAGRRVRYEALREYAAGGKIAVAHNAGDQQETVLMNIIRGSGLKGAAGMDYVSGDIIRPLLGIGRDEIEAYLSGRGQAYCTDSTNLADDYTRNKIRHVLLPLLETLNPSAGNHMTAFAEDCREAENYLEGRAEEILGRCPLSGGVLTIPDDITAGEPPVILSRLVHRAIARQAGRSKDITRAHVAEVMELRRGRTGAVVHLPYKLIAARSYDGIRIERRETGDGGGCDRRDQVTELNRKLAGSHIIKYTKELIIPEKAYTKWFDYDRIQGTLCWRTRESGDTIALGGVGAKSLHRFMIDCKIPREDRDLVPVLADGHDILWVLGYRISERYKVTPATKQVIEVNADYTYIRGSEV